MQWEKLPSLCVSIALRTEVLCQKYVILMLVRHWSLWMLFLWQLFLKIIPYKMLQKCILHFSFCMKFDVCPRSHLLFFIVLILIRYFNLFAFWNPHRYSGILTRLLQVLCAANSIIFVLFFKCLFLQLMFNTHINKQNNLTLQGRDEKCNEISWGIISCLD